MKFGWFLRIDSRTNCSREVFSTRVRLINTCHCLHVAYPKIRTHGPLDSLSNLMSFRTKHGENQCDQSVLTCTFRQSNPSKLHFSVQNENDLFIICSFDNDSHEVHTKFSSYMSFVCIGTSKTSPETRNGQNTRPRGLEALVCPPIGTYWDDLFRW